MSSSSNQIASLGSGNASFRHRGSERMRGFPESCRCGRGSVIRTSKTTANPGRLFHCCPYGSEKEKSHLFQWTDKSMVEEIEDLKELVGEIKREVQASESDIGNVELEKKIEHMKVVLLGYEKEIEDKKNVVHGCEKEVKECKRELCSLKNMIVCGVVVVVFYYCFFRKCIKKWSL